MKVLTVYVTKYGNKEKVANLIVGEVYSIKGNEVIAKDKKNVKLKEDVTYDLILI